MSRLEQLEKRYRTHAQVPWGKALAGAQRVWFVVYDEDDERRLRARLGHFELATTQAGHNWVEFDVTHEFSRWFATLDYCEAYCNKPQLLVDSALAEFRDELIANLLSVLAREDVTSNTVVAITGVAALFGFMKVSQLVENVQSAVHGRLVVFFPGAYQNHIYRFMDARVGWNYLAFPLTDVK